jgi:hypothetical protein
VLPNDARIRQVPGPVARYCCGCRLLHSPQCSNFRSKSSDREPCRRQAVRAIAALPRLPLHRNPPLRGPHGRASQHAPGQHPPRTGPAHRRRPVRRRRHTSRRAPRPVRVDAVRSQACWATSAAASSTAARVVDGAPMSASSPRTPTGPPPRPVRCGSAPTGRNTSTPRPRRPASRPARCGWSTPVRQDAIDVGAIVDVRPRSGRCQRRLDDQVLDCAEVRISLTPRPHPACRSQSTAVRRACPAASASARATRGPPDAVRARRRHPLSGPGRAPVARRPSHAAAARTPPAALPP